LATFMQVVSRFSESPKQRSALARPSYLPSEVQTRAVPDRERIASIGDAHFLIRRTHGDYKAAETSEKQSRSSDFRLSSWTDRCHLDDVLRVYFPSVRRRGRLSAATLE